MLVRLNGSSYYTRLKVLFEAVSLHVMTWEQTFGALSSKANYIRSDYDRVGQG